MRREIIVKFSLSKIVGTTGRRKSFCPYVKRKIREMLPVRKTYVK